MQPISVTCLFCEDIRQEHNEMNTLVGILPDNMQLSTLPAMLPKLGVYIRVNIDPTEDPGSITLELSVPGESVNIPISEIKPELIEKSRKQAQAAGSPLAGIISRAVFAPFRIHQPGRIRALASIRGEPVTCGGLNLVLKAASPSAVSNAV